MHGAVTIKDSISELDIVISFGKEGKEKSNLSSSVYLNLPKYKWFIYLLVGDVLLYSLWPGFIL